MRHEIGSEFWTGCSPIGKEGCEWALPRNWSLKETLSGRVALEYIVEQLVKQKFTSVYMPSYCCHTMIEPFLKHGLSVKFYDVVLTETKLKKEFDPNHGCDVVFLLDYYGYVDAETMLIAKNQHAEGKLVIYDATHSIYSNISYDNCDYVFGSYRKWMDVNCGFVAVKNSPNIEFGADWHQFDGYNDMRKHMFDLKSCYMNDEDVDKQQFLEWINEAEEMLERDYHHTLPDQRSLDVLHHTDCSFLVQSRRHNASVIMKCIAEIGDKRIRCFVGKIGEHDVPLFVPVFVQAKYRNELRRYLIEHDIYCPVHWPVSEMHQMMTGNTMLFESELSLICDQRYNSGDMIRIADTVKHFFQV